MSLLQGKRMNNIVNMASVRIFVFSPLALKFQLTKIFVKENQFNNAMNGFQAKQDLALQLLLG